MAARTPRAPRPEQPELLVPDVAAWRAWLDEHEDTSDGVWLVLAKKGKDAPTTLVYDTALDEALCSGWIDGQARGGEELVYRQRFTPRRQRSMWSARNVGHVARLTAEGRMRPRGVAEVERARADGRWDAAYAGPATAVVPPDLEAALAATPAARAAFDGLDATNRYAILHRVGVPRTEKGRAAAVERLVARLAEGWLPHPKP